MSQRSPLNQRNLNNDLVTGTTRKSASSAKPKRQAAESVHVVRSDAPKSKKDRKRAQRAQLSKRNKEDEHRLAMSGGPTDPAYKKWRRVWWATMIATIVFIMSYAIAGGSFNVSGPILTFLMVMAYVMLAAAVIVEFKFCRPIRKDFEKSIRNMSSSQKKRFDAEIAIREAEKEAAKQERRENSAVGKAVGAATKAFKRGGKNVAAEKIEKVAEEVEEEKARMEEAKQAAAEAPKRKADSKQNTRKKTPAQKRAERAARAAALEGSETDGEEKQSS